MSETLFTKGEWWVNHVGKHWNNPGIDSYEICWSKDAECVVEHVYELADAHLIASAPKMYNKLQSLADSGNLQGSVEREVLELLASARGE